jgi:S-adenosylmethionine hydrolase
LIDHFGNLISDVAALPTDRGSVRVGGVRVPLVSSYQAADGALGALVNAWGVVEVFVDRGRAVDQLAAGVGTPIAFEPDP